MLNFMKSASGGRSLKGLAVPIIISILFLFTFASGLLTKIEPVIKIFASGIQDTTDIPSPPSIKDVSQMFNERGFYNSNGFSFDENEIINDFNGNLMYKIPLYKYKLAGEMQFEVELVYNGSVGHQTNLGDKVKWVTNTVQSSHNFNLPEWILSVNGIAAQVFNFEPNFFSKPPTSSPNEIKNYDLHLLIPGYHYDDAMKHIDYYERNRINILMGDGSVVTLVNKSWMSNEGEELRFIGSYHSEGKETHYKATLTYLEGQTGIPYNSRNRKVEFTKGDGMVFVFYEYRRDFKDLGVNDIPDYASHRRPQMLILQEIKDRFGYRIDMAYQYTSAPGVWNGVLYGRPLLVGINNNIGYMQNANVGIAYSGSLIKLYNNTDVNGNYSLQIFQTSYYSSVDNNIAAVTKIINPVFQEAVIDYEPEFQSVRKLLNVINPLNNQAMTVTNNLQRRMSKFTNFLGGVREYKYFPENVNELTMFLNISDFNFDQQGYYRGYGREPFYTHMLLNKKDKDGTQYKSETTFEYYYDDPQNNKSAQPVDANDNYETRKTTVSLDGTTNNDSKTTQFVKRFYKVYPVRYSSDVMSEVLDFNGVTKLIKEEFIDPENNNMYQKNEYTYSVEPINNNIVYNGSFLMTNKKNYTEGKLREWNYQYKQFGDNNDSLIIKSVETDPKGIKAFAEYNNFYRQVNINLATGGYQGATNGTMVYYKIGIPSIESKYRANSDPINNPTYNRLFHKTYTYISDDQNPLGYFGQLLNEKVYENINFVSSIKTEYEYYKLDNTGSELYGGGMLPYKEGNPKLLIKPNGEEEKYFYHPITASEDHSGGDQPQFPKISYKVKYNNGNIETLSEHIWDHRLPTRIDNYKRTGPNSVDTLKKIYMQYNAAGLPIKIINENNFLTEFIYQRVHRISSITLPGDFSTVASYDEPHYSHNYYYSSIVHNSNAWGNVDLKAGINKATYMPNPYNIANNCYYFSMDYDNSSPTKEQAAFMKFDINNLNGFSSIDSAYFEMWPQCYRRLINGVTPPPSLYNTRLQPIYDLTGPETHIECPGTGLNWLQRTVLLHSYIQLIDVNTDDVNCGESPCWFTPNKFDITGMLTSMINNGKNLKGLIVKPQFNIPYENGNTIQFWMRFIKPVCLVQGTWAQNYGPRITIHGSFDDVDTLTIRVVMGGTYVYQYDDVNKTTLISSRLSHSPNKLKRVKYYVDGFGNIKKKDVYKVDDLITPQINVYNYKFNYLGKLAEEIDAKNNSTKYSYDNFTRNSKTKFVDNNTTNTAYSYQNNLQNYFGTTYGTFIEKQVFTDESNKSFEKYFDEVGNLLREVKYVSIDSDPDNPYNPDTTFDGNDNPGDQALITDYKYDDLYRLTEVKTPNNKHIYYYYDGYNRQRARNTPDAGITDYTYDNNNNLVYSRDANQYARGADVYTFRYYDALNRLTIIGENPHGGGGGNFEDIDIENPPQLDNPAGENMFTVNVYDSLPTAVVNIFEANKPSDYYSSNNYTKGNLVATAYRTRLSDGWGFKFYRYNERGNVVKMWHKIDGLGWKVMDNNYNSQNQVSRLNYQLSQSDGKLFTYGYDDAGRLSYSNLYVGTNPSEPEEETDAPFAYWTLAAYTYNENSQVETHKVNNNQLTTTYSFNNRNWIKWTNQTPEIYRYVLLYNPNGNINLQTSEGSYVNSFSDNTERTIRYVYDKSNRLLTADYKNMSAQQRYKVVNSYDADGNLQILRRYNQDNSLVDNFSYSYYSGTNRLKNIGGIQDYTYDANGNVTTDDLNKNGLLKYDYRNLLIENSNGLSMFPYKTFYKYDEAGNRINKRQYIWVIGILPGGIEDNIGGNDSLFLEEGDGSGYWSMTVNIFYVRDVNGKEIAVYDGAVLKQWNIWGLDQVGHMNADTSKYYYLKDHLGSISCVINSRNSVRSAQDYDMWGYAIESRTYQPENVRYKFTGKEHDNALENNYDYFGARYYDSRIGRWGGVEPLYEKYITVSPYAYSLLNPIMFLDNNGFDVGISGEQVSETYTALVNSLPNLGLQIDDNGNLSYSDMVGRVTKRELVLMNAIDNPNIKVVLETINSNFVPEEYADPQFEQDPLIVGRFAGSYTNSEGQLIAKNFFNINQAKIWEEAGGSDPGESAAHEIIEAYLGGYYFPNTGYEQSFKKSHEMTVNLEGQRYYPTAEPHGIQLNVKGPGRIRITYIDLFDPTGGRHRLFSNY